MTGPTLVNHQQLNALAAQMDELSHRAVDVLQRYSDAVQHANSGQILVGSAGQAHLVTSEQIHQAQTSIQNRFRAVNEVLRQGSGHYQNTDEDNSQMVASLASNLRFT